MPAAAVGRASRGFAATLWDALLLGSRCIETLHLDGAYDINPSSYLYSTPYSLLTPPNLTTLPLYHFVLIQGSSPSSVRLVSCPTPPSHHLRSPPLCNARLPHRPDCFASANFDILFPLCAPAAGLPLHWRNRQPDRSRYQRCRLLPLPRDRWVSTTIDHQVHRN